jgi:glycosyltransferase involved in cell wall biosynthesis
MSKRLKVLMSAYACEPGKGSEPEVGWQWALQMARFHDVTVLTRTNNRAAIEAETGRLAGRQPLPEFIYHDRGPALLRLKARLGAVKAYYILWQRSAHEIVSQLHQLHRFDLMHHVTFAGFRYPTAIWGHGVPTIWGPIGGIESVPRPLLPWRHPLSLSTEMARNIHNVIQATPYHVLPRRARATTLLLASTPEMQEAIHALGFEAQVMPTIGLKPAELPYRPHSPSQGPLKLLFVGNLITLKGLDLAIAALKQSQTNATLTLIGSGSYEARARQTVKKDGLGDRIRFLGRLPRSQVLQTYADYDVFLFPSLHDTGGYAVIEAMANELPVICLDCGGPAVAVQPDCGIRVPLGPRSSVVAGLAAAIRSYAGDRATLAAHGQAARAAILRRYDWDRKGEEMQACYAEAIRRQRAGLAVTGGYSGVGGLANFLHQMVSLKGLAVAFFGLVLIGALGFFSVGQLKKQAREIVQDTLPGLSYAGEANASLAQAFNRTLLLLVTEPPAERAQLQKEVESFSRATSTYLEAYRKQIFAAEDQALFDRLIRRRTEYIAVRERLIDLVDHGRNLDAVQLSKSELLPAYSRYKDAGDQIFQYNMREGKARGRTIMTVCTVTQIFAAVVGVLIFILGFLIGLFK